MTNKLFATEQHNAQTGELELLSTLEALRVMNAEDQKVAVAVEKALPQIAALVDVLAERLQDGGRLIYIGAGTSGRIGVLDASECPPTFYTDPKMIVGIIAGRDPALRTAVENAEDDYDAGVAIVKEYDIGNKDVVVCISASGSAAYVQGAADAAHKAGATTGCICTASNAPLLKMVDYPILADTGPEVIAGSTRLKSGTAQKLVANNISTITMVKLGKTCMGYMVDVKFNNEKLKQRARNMVKLFTGCDDATADASLEKTRNCKLSIVMLLEKLDDVKQAEALLVQNGNQLIHIVRKHRTI